MRKQWLLLGATGIAFFVGASVGSFNKPASIPRDWVPPYDVIIPSIEMEKVPFSEAIQFLRSSSGANIVVNWRAVEAEGIERDQPITLHQLKDVPFDKALSLVLREAAQSWGQESSLTYRWRRNVLTITTLEDLEAVALARSYDVRDLLEEWLTYQKQHGKTGLAQTGSNGLFNGGTSSTLEEEATGELRAMVLENAAPDSWIDNGGKYGSCRFWAGRMIVVQSEGGHRQVAEFLQVLRRKDE